MHVRFFHDELYFQFLTESPRIQTILPIHQLLNETDTFEIFCNATGHPPPTITWAKDGDNSKAYPTGKTLRVQNTDKSDFGTYHCTVVSVRGENVTAVASVELDYCKWIMLSHVESFNTLLLSLRSKRFSFAFLLIIFIGGITFSDLLRLSWLTGNPSLNSISIPPKAKGVNFNLLRTFDVAIAKKTSRLSSQSNPTLRGYEGLTKDITPKQTRRRVT